MLNSCLAELLYVFLFELIFGLQRCCSVFSLCLCVIETNETCTAVLTHQVASRVFSFCNLSALFLKPLEPRCLRTPSRAPITSSWAAISTGLCSCPEGSACTPMSKSQCFWRRIRTSQTDTEHTCHQNSASKGAFLSLFETVDVLPPVYSLFLVTHSIFILSNETVNIWSHLLGFLLFFSLGVYDMVTVLPSAGASREDYVIYSIGLFCFQVTENVGKL